MAKRLPPELEAALSKIEPTLRKAFEEAVAKQRSAIDVKHLIDLLTQGRIDEAIEAARIDAGFYARLSDAIREAFATGGELVLSGLRLKDPFSGARFVLGFDGRHDRAEEWVRSASSALITEIVDDQRQMVRAVMVEDLAAGQNPTDTALEIAGRMNRATGRRDGGLIGLTSQQAGYVRRARDELSRLDPAYFSRERRDRRFDALVRKAIESGKPISKADLDRIAGRYSDRLLKLRGDTIARTETLNALRAGRHEGFAQLIDSGKVRRDQIAITWSATMDGRTRDTHRHMNGQKIGFGGLFISESGAQFEFPGDTSHGAPAAEVIQCRCYAEYRISYG